MEITAHILIAYEICLLILIGYLLLIKRSVEAKKNLLFTVPAFVVPYTMYLLEAIAAGEKINLFFLIKNCLTIGSFLSLDYDTSTFENLINKYPIYDFAFTLMAVLSITSIAFGVLVIFGNYITHFFRLRLKICKKADIVIGYSESGIKYLENNKNAIMWADGLNKGKRNSLWQRGFAVYTGRFDVKWAKANLSKREHHFIAFKDTEYSYSSLISWFEKIKVGKRNLLYLHLETDQDKMRIVREKYTAEVDKDSNSFVTSFSKHELIARDVCFNHPITKYIPRDFINDNLTLRKGKKINVVFVGFGKTNQALLKTMATQFQFAYNGDRTAPYISCPTNFYIFDKSISALNSSIASKLTEKYETGFKKSDFPTPDKICNIEIPKPIEVTSLEFKDKLKKLIGNDSYTYIVISLSDDLHDASYAYTLSHYLGEGNYKILVRAKKNDNKALQKGEESIIYFGEERDFYSHSAIVNETFMNISQSINNLYGELSSVRKENIRAWESLSVTEQHSNISNALNLTFKFNLMGFDLKKTGDCITKQEYLSVYQKGLDPIDTYKDKGVFFKTNPANTLAFIEHQRWNAYHMLLDYTSLPVSEFWWDTVETNEGKKQKLMHKNERELKHACITTYMGLKDLINVKKEILDTAKADGRNIKEESERSLYNIYRYDYMVMDAAHDALTKKGIDFKITRLIK